MDHESTAENRQWRKITSGADAVRARGERCIRERLVGLSGTRQPHPLRWMLKTCVNMFSTLHRVKQP